MDLRMIQMSLTEHLQRDADRLDIMKNIIHSFEVQIFALHRGGSLSVVNNLMELCNAAVVETLLEKDTTVGKAIVDLYSRKAIVKALLSAGILQSLLSTWSQSLSSTWSRPEIEKQLLKVIAILVTYEENRQQLRHNAGTILPALHKLLIISSSVLFSCDGITSKSDGKEVVDEQEHMKGLIAAAVTKLSSVLTSEWTSILLNFIVMLCVSTSPSFTNPLAAATPQCSVSSTVIQCSAALLHLAEVPLHRPGLVSNGALKLIKSWLELGTMVLGKARASCFEVTDALDSSTHHYDDDEYANSFFAQFGPVYQLVGNAAAALMFIAGGIDHTRSQSGVQVTDPSTGNNTNGIINYEVGWIDAQILSEGLPFAIITLIDASMESFIESFDSDNVSITEEAIASSLHIRSTRSVLPAVISMHLVQTLYELNSRPQNRQLLHLIDIPHALCVLFENISSQIELIVGDSQGSSSSTKLDGSSTSCRNQHPTAREATAAEKESFNHLSNVGIVESPPNRNTLFTRIFYFGFESDDSFITSRSSQQLLNSTITGYYEEDSIHSNTSLFNSTVGYNCNHNEIQQLSASAKAIPRDLLIILSSITSSCLDILVSVADEERNILPFCAMTNAEAQFSLKKRHPSIGTSIFDLISHRKIIKAIKIASSLLRDGKGKLSTMKVIAILTGRCDCFRAVFEGGIVDILLDMSREAAQRQVQLQADEELKKAAVQRSSHQQQGPSSSSWTSLAVGLKTRRFEFPSIEVAASDAFSFLISGGSSLSGLSEDTSNYAKNNSSCSRHRIETGLATDDDDDERVEICKEVLREQTLYMCYSLANLCEAITQKTDTVSAPAEGVVAVNYAQYCYSNDLFLVMLRLVRNSCSEINRHALRCISAMCMTIAASSAGVDSEDNMVGKGLLQASLPSTATIVSQFQWKGDKSGEFFEALDVLTDCLVEGGDVELQRYCIDIVAQFAAMKDNEKLQDSVVDGPLKIIMTLMMDPMNDRDFRRAAEQVLRNLGFQDGLRDFELCGYDFDILKVWYRMKRSLHQQDLIQLILKNWVHKLFEEMDPFSGGMMDNWSNTAPAVPNNLLRHDFQVTDLAIDLALETASILNYGVRNISSTEVSNKELNFSSLKEATRDSENSFAPSNSIPQALIASNKKRSSSSDKHSLSKSVTVMASELVHQVSGNFLQLQLHHPFLARTAASKNPCVAKTKGGLSNEASISHQIDRSDSYPTTSPALMAGINCSYETILANADGNYHWLDRPPLGTIHFLDLFYPSKLHQLLLMDLTSLGVLVSSSSSSPSPTAKDDNCSLLQPPLDSNLSYVLPSPHAVSTIILPSRTYQSFVRMGRVIEKMVQVQQQQHHPDRYDCSKMKWSLVFRDSKYMGDFHASLLSTLLRFPQISSLSFTSSTVVEKDALLGHMVGQLPPSIRYLSFKSTLSRESVQAMCILLRQQNAAFLNREQSSSSRGRLSCRYESKSNGLSASDDMQEGISNSRGKGLLGLALTYLTLDDSEISGIIDLLLLHRKSKMMHSPCSSDGSMEHHLTCVTSATSETTQTNPITHGLYDREGKANNNHNSIGLRFLDLSFNQLSEGNCARILAGAVKGPLEGLDLGGNSIGNEATKFIEAMDVFSATRMMSMDFKHQLRHLGLSSNGLNSKTVKALLEPLKTNMSLTSLDLSYNELDHSKESNMMLMDFVRCNSGLRYLDLCCNKLDAGTYRELHLGLLENHTMLLLPLAGNPSVDLSPTIHLIQVKLRKNRLAYKANTQENDCTFQGGGRGGGSVTEYYVHQQQQQIQSSAEQMMILPTHKSSARVDTATVQSSDITLCSDSQSGESSPVVMPAVLISNCLGHSNTPILVAVENHPPIPSGIGTGPKTVSAKNRNASQDSTVEATSSSLLYPVVPVEIYSYNTLNVLFSTPLAYMNNEITMAPMDVLDYSKERDLLMQVFKEVQRDVSVHFDFATTDTLCTTLTLGCKALHFSCHGIPEGLCFEDGRLGLQRVWVEQLKALLKKGRLSLQFVFVSACYSRAIGDVFVEAGVPHVVCVNNTKVQDAAAIAFSRAFYIALLSGKTVKDSFYIAKGALGMSPYKARRDEVDKFILLPLLPLETEDVNTTTQHDIALFVNKKLIGSEWPVSGKHCTIGSKRADVSTFYHLPLPPYDFEGREVDVHRLIMTILDKRLVSLVGDDGIGKSSIAAAACKYMSDRDKFPNGGITFFNAKKGNDYRSFLTGLQMALQRNSNISVASTMRELMKTRNDDSNNQQQQQMIMYPEEGRILSCIQPLHMLLVLDNVDDLLSNKNDSHADFRLFLDRLLGQCQYVKLVIVTTETLSIRCIILGSGIVEYSVNLDPLSLYSSIRLFAKLAPCLSTSKAKMDFISALLPQRYIHTDRDMWLAARKLLLQLIGDGYPSRIVYMVQKSTQEKVQQLIEDGESILKETYNGFVDLQSVASN